MPTVLLEGSRNQVVPESLLKDIVPETHYVLVCIMQKYNNIVKHKVLKESIEANKHIPSLSQEIFKFNPGSQICCQLDMEEGWFYRYFMLLPSSLTSLNASLKLAVERQDNLNPVMSSNQMEKLPD
jgi:hypothetical protein